MHSKNAKSVNRTYDQPPTAGQSPSFESFKHNLVSEMILDMKKTTLGSRYRSCKNGKSRSLMGKQSKSGSTNNTFILPSLTVSGNDLLDYTDDYTSIVSANIDVHDHKLRHKHRNLTAIYVPP